MIRIDKVSHIGYTLLIDGNGGENQMVVVVSSGQDGSVGIRIVYVSVDDGSVPETEELQFKKAAGEYATHQARWKDLYCRAINAVEEKVVAWSKRGIPGTQDMSEVLASIRRGYINET